MEDPDGGDPTPWLTLLSPTDPVVPIAVRGVPGDEPSLCARLEDAYAAHQRELFSFLVHLTRDPGIAEDLTQEALLRLYRELRGGRGPENTRAWLYRVAANLAISRERRLGVARRWLSRVARDDTTDETPERSALRLERHQRVAAALAELPRDARVGLLMAANGFTGREVAMALGRSEAATRTMLCRARMRLRRVLEGEGSALEGEEAAQDPSVA